MFQSVINSITAMIKLKNKGKQAGFQTEVQNWYTINDEMSVEHYGEKKKY